MKQSGLQSLPFENISAYKFVDLEHDWIRDLRPRLLQHCNELNLRGSILLSPEGINLFLSGRHEETRSFRATISNLPPFADLKFRISFSSEHSFRRMLVKIKREIIPLGIPSIRPFVSTAERIQPGQLRRWIEEGRDVILLDARNDYEVELGTFRNAIDLGLQNFRSFPDAVQYLDESLKKKTVVTFCTGGIRCEKAAPLMQDLGFENVYQLDGGILGYFEECGGAYWEGECFVFDGRVAVDADLLETDTEFCFRCQHLLRPDELRDPAYQPGVQCPYCAPQE